MTARPYTRRIPYGSARHLSASDHTLLHDILTEQGVWRLGAARWDALAHLAGVDPDTLPAEAVDEVRGELGRRLWDDLAALPLSDRDRAIVLAWLDGASLREAGAGLSPERTRQIVLQTLGRLRERSSAVRWRITPVAGEPEWWWPRVLEAA